MFWKRVPARVLVCACVCVVCVQQWLTGILGLMAQSFEALNPRAVAVVVDPIQSVKGKVVIDAFRCASESIHTYVMHFMGLLLLWLYNMRCDF